MVVVIDPQIAGISGDMLLCGLVDIGAKKSKIITGVKKSEQFLKNSKISKIDFKKINKHGVSATSLVLNLDEHIHERKATEILNCIRKSAQKIGLSNQATKFAIDSITTLIYAESKIHGVPKNSVHFHEAASIDTVVDVLGTAIALDDLNFFGHQIITMPVAVGSGTVTFSHGIVSNPAGAILKILEKSGIIISGKDSNSELTTPTGACMLVNLVNKCSENYPMMKIETSGYGAGQKNFEHFSNVLKIVVGKQSQLQSDTVSVLETNVDDVSGELLGHVIEMIMSNGAKDTFIVPTFAKKGRPGHIISVICDHHNVEKLVNILMSETGTLGVRIRTTERFIIPRKITNLKVKIHNFDFLIRYKIAGKSFKIEYDDIKKVSKKLMLTFKQTEELIKAEIKKQLK